MDTDRGLGEGHHSMDCRNCENHARILRDRFAAKLAGLADQKQGQDRDQMFGEIDGIYFVAKEFGVVLREMDLVAYAALDRRYLTRRRGSTINSNGNGNGQAAAANPLGLDFMADIFGEYDGK